MHQFHTRIIASANRTSDELVQSGLLRQDLLYRLNAVEIHMPRLRERRADIPLLCSHFISRSSTLRNKRVRIRGVTDEALEILCAHTFPGNVRELANTIEYAGIVASGEWIRPKDLPYQFTNARPGLGEVERLPERHCRSSNGLPSRPLTAQTPESAARWSPSSASARAGFGTS